MTAALGEFDGYLAQCSDTIEAAAGGSGIPVCGDTIVSAPGEECDGANLNGASCASLGHSGGGTLACTAGCTFDRAACVGPGPAFPASGQTTCWNSSGSVIACAGTGHDGENQAGATLAYADNGDGTVTDLNTGLMWEKLSDDGSIHDKDNHYDWNDAFAVEVAALNTPSCFAGYCDWRVPNVKELQSIVNYEIAYPGPAVAPAFNASCAASCTVLTCRCTASSYYWSSSSNANNPNNAWNVNFDNGNVNNDNKTNDNYVRAVRAGS